MSNSSIEKGPEPVYSEAGSTEKARPVGFGAKLKAHLRRFWWLHLIIFVICTLVITLPLVLVGFPHIAQDSVNKSTLKINAIRLTKPTEKSLYISQDEVLSSNSIYHPTLDSFRAALFLESSGMDPIKPFAYIQVPKTVSTKATPIHIEQTLEIADLDEFTKYTTTVTNSEEYRLGVRGRTQLHQTALKTINVDYNEVVTLKGLNSLKGLNVTDVAVKLKPEDDGTNMVGKVLIPNPTVMTLEMGNVSLNLYIDKDFVGIAKLADLTLVPGDNTVEMRATANQTIIAQKLATHTNGILPVDIIGNSSVYNGQHLTYYEKALGSTSQRVMLNAAAALSAALSGGGD